MNELVGVGVGDSIASLENLPNTFCKKIRETLKSVRAIFDVFSRYRSTAFHLNYNWKGVGW
jgi:hypothetical protein